MAAGANQPALSECSGRALRVAERQFDRWLRSEERSAVALRVSGSAAQLRERLMLRVKSTLQQENPDAAACQWISDSVAAWAPLELMFPVCDHAGSPGVSGDISLHAAALLQLSYGHVIAGCGDVATACAQLQADLQRLDLEICAARALCGALDESSATDTFWVEDLRAMQLAMAEYLHRNALELPQLLSEALLSSYTDRIATLQRNLRARHVSPSRQVRHAAV